MSTDCCAPTEKREVQWLQIVFQQGEEARCLKELKDRLTWWKRYRITLDSHYSIQEGRWLRRIDAREI